LDVLVEARSTDERIPKRLVDALANVCHFCHGLYLSVFRF
jgi:hypothetical protein